MITTPERNSKAKSSYTFKEQVVYNCNSQYPKAHDRALDMRIRKYCKQAGIQAKSNHDARRTYCSVAHDTGVSFPKLKELMGHKDIRTTMNCYCYDTREDIETRNMLNSIDFLS